MSTASAVSNPTRLTTNDAVSAEDNRAKSHIFLSK